MMNVDDAVTKTGLFVLRFFHGMSVTNSADAGAAPSMSAQHKKNAIVRIDIALRNERYATKQIVGDSHKRGDAFAVPCRTASAPSGGCERALL